MSRFRGFTSFDLKIIAVISMIIDHTGVILFPGVDIFRIIGRIAFPIYCFLLVEGFFNTSSREAYVKRLCIFAVISEIPFDLSLYNEIFKPERQNVFFTLAIGLYCLSLIDEMDEYEDTFYKCCVGFFAIIVTSKMQSDYSIYGIFMIFFFYFFRENKIRCAFWQTFMNGIAMGGLQWAGVISIILINMYNGRSGSKKFKWLFYAIYPLHLLVLRYIKFKMYNV